MHVLLRDCFIDNSSHTRHSLPSILVLYSAKPDQVCLGWSVMNAESIVGLSNSSWDLSVTKPSGFMFPVSPLHVCSCFQFLHCLSSGWLLSALSIASFLSSGTSSLKKARTTRSSARYHK